MSALNACTSASDSSQGNSKKVTKQRAQELLDEWVANGYFSYVDDSYILGPRAIGEFGDMLIARFGDQLKKCFLCKNITFKVRVLLKILTSTMSVYTFCLFRPNRQTIVQTHSATFHWMVRAPKSIWGDRKNAQSASQPGHMRLPKKKKVMMINKRQSSDLHQLPMHKSSNSKCSWKYYEISDFLHSSFRINY